MSTFCPSCGAAVAAGVDKFCRSCGTPTAAPALLPQKGWYPQSDDSADLRYWDGRSWTDHIVAREVKPVLERLAPGPGLKAMDVAFISYALAVAMSLAVIRIMQKHGDPGGDATELFVSELFIWGPLLLGVYLVSKGRGTGSWKKDFGARISGRDIGVGLLAGAIARGTSTVVAIPLFAAFQNLYKSPQIGPTNDHVQAAVLPVFALVACIGAPIVEELFFRGLIQTRLVGKWGRNKGIAVTSVLFGAAHLIGWQGPSSILAAVSIASAGVVLGYIKERTGRLGPGMVAHSLSNLIVVLL